ASFPFGSGLRAAAKDVEPDGADDDEARDHRLPLVGNARDGQADTQGAEEEGADDRPDDAALAAGKGCAADDSRGDRVELVAHAEARLCRVHAWGEACAA